MATTTVSSHPNVHASLPTQRKLRSRQTFLSLANWRVKGSVQCNGCSCSQYY
jgi:hypothetical protein